MDALVGMKVFARVAQAAGFAAAGRSLRMSPAAVSKHVAALEARLGARLFDRTTRRVALTEAGRVYLDRCLEALQAFDDADASVRELARRPRGLLRVSAPVDMGPQVTPVLSRLLAVHPDLVVDLRLSNRPVDLVDEGIDVAVRVAPSLDGPYVARPLAVTRFAIAASPAYLRRHGHPRRPAELARHRNLMFVEPRVREEWTFERRGRRVRVSLAGTGAMMSNSGDSLRAAAIAGAGLATIPSFLLGGTLESGQLELVLLDWTIVPLARVFAIYPHRRFVSPAVRLFVEALREELGDGTADPWWPGRAGAIRT